MVLKNEKLKKELLSFLKRSVIGFFLGYAIALLAKEFDLTTVIDWGKRSYLSWHVVLSVMIIVAIYPYIWEVFKGKR